MTTGQNQDAPTGTVTLVFTDIQGSTALWERIPTAMKKALALHDECVRSALVDHGGYEMRTEGDAFKVAFGSPAEAIRWSIDVQRRLMGLSWPEPLATQPECEDVVLDDGTVVLRGLRVRMGAHTGRPDCQLHPTTGRMDYYGPMVNETARVAAACHGGQFVVTNFSWEAGRRDGDLSEVVHFDLGRHRLKGLAEPEHLVDLRAAELAGRSFPQLKTESVRRTNLVSQGDTFFGRHEELAGLAKMIDGGARLVSIVGPGGTGKTRLATEFGLGLIVEFSADGGVWICDLEEETDLAGVGAGLARALAIPVNEATTAAQTVESLGRTLARLSPVLVVLDNLEQVIAPAREAVSIWMRAAPEARFLVTSREPLGVPGERRLELGALDCDQARELFLDRVRQVRPSVDVSEQDEIAVRDITQRLDEMPLALELAASRANVMSIPAIAHRLDQRFRLLSSQRGDESKQSTLRATIDWSWNLLDAAERAALAQCSVFVGGFTIDAAEAVVDLEGDHWPLDVVASLQQKSLIFSREARGELRLGLYQSILVYAKERLQEMGAAASIAERHAAHFSEQAARWRLDCDTLGEIEAHRAITAEADNLRAAYRHAQAGHPERACDIVLSLARVLASSGPGAWFGRLLDEAVAAAEILKDPGLLAGLLAQRARMHQSGARPRKSDADALRALEVARASGDHALLEAQALMSRGMLFFYRIRPDEESRAMLEQAEERATSGGDPVLLRVVQALLAFLDDDGDRCEELAKELFTLGAQVQSAWMHQIASVKFNQQQRYAQARAAAVAAVPTWEAIGCRNDIFSSQAQLGLIAIGEGSPIGDHIQDAIEAIRPVDAPGKHACIRLMRLASEWMAVRAAGGDEAEVMERARQALAQARAPGVATPDYPDRVLPWTERSAWARRWANQVDELLSAEGRPVTHDEA